MSTWGGHRNHKSYFKNPNVKYVRKLIGVSIFCMPIRRRQNLDFHDSRCNAFLFYIHNVIFAPNLTVPENELYGRSVDIHSFIPFIIIFITHQKAVNELSVG